MDEVTFHMKGGRRIRLMVSDWEFGNSGNGLTMYKVTVEGASRLRYLRLSDVAAVTVRPIRFAPLWRLLAWFREVF